MSSNEYNLIATKAAMLCILRYKELPHGDLSFKQVLKEVAAAHRPANTPQPLCDILDLEEGSVLKKYDLFLEKTFSSIQNKLYLCMQPRTLQ